MPCGMAAWCLHAGCSRMVHLFSGKTVLELGCGVGLPGIVAAHWASHVYLTDYVEDGNGPQCTT